MRIVDGTQANTALEQVAALIFHARGGKNALLAGAPVNPGDAYVTLNPVENGIIQAGRPVDEASYSNLLGAVMGLKGRVRRILPPNVLYAEPGDRMLWYVPGRKRTIWFRTDQKDWNREMNGKTVVYPPLLFLARPQSLCVWALPSVADRPGPETKLYLAPFYNIYGSGLMCEGNAPLPSGLEPSRIPAWEATFFDTEFTHSNYGSVAVTQHPKGHAGLWREMAKLAEKRSPEPFPTRYLTPARTESGRPLTIGVVLNL